jgi:preprotein translocase subunit YajC
MDESTFRRRFYMRAGAGALLLLIPVWAFVRGALSSREFSVAALAIWIVMFAAFFTLARSRQQSAEESRRQQIEAGTPVEAIERDRCLKNIRIMKRLIVMHAAFLIYGEVATQGDPLLPRVVGTAFVAFLLVTYVRSLRRSQKKLKQLMSVSLGVPPSSTT